MTCFDTAAARRKLGRIAQAALITVVGVILAGCETSSLLGSSNPVAEQQPAVAQPAPQRQPAARVAIAPVIGAPDALGKQLVAQLGESIQRRNMALAASKDDRPDYVLRGYVVASKEKAQAKLAYIWDVTDAQGKRINRITGEELIANPGGRDPWSLVTPEHARGIAEKTATSLAAAVPSAAPGAVAQATGGAPAGVGAQGPAPASAVAPQPAAAPAVAPAAQPAVAKASVGPEPAAKDQRTAVPTLSGAPGDGNSALADALRRELTKNGVAVADRTAGVYKVLGRVAMGQPKDGKQTIQIDWTVQNTAGKSLGTVTQKNEVPQGSLDGQWGRTADAAAAAAAQGILKLIPGASR